MFYTVHILSKLNSEDDPAVRAVVKQVEVAVLACGIKRVDRFDIEGHTLIIAVGGDGTMLEAMRMAALHDATAIGINLGRVGFLSDINVKDEVHGPVEAQLYKLLSGQLLTHVEHRTVLVSSINDRAIACNEISVSPLQSDSMVTYHLHVGHTSAGIHRANSIMVSTATGSTAYSLSAGGALMMPELDALQIVPVAPITMTSRPLLVPGSSNIRLEVISTGIAVRTDGQMIDSNGSSWTRKDPYVISIRRYLREAKVLHITGWNYFDVLTQKLGWIKE